MVGRLGGQNGRDGLGEHGLEFVAQEGGGVSERVATHGLRLGRSCGSVQRLVFDDDAREVRQETRVGKRVCSDVRRGSRGGLVGIRERGIRGRRREGSWRKSEEGRVIDNSHVLISGANYAHRK